VITKWFLCWQWKGYFD